MSTHLPRQVAGARISRQCPPLSDGWFGTHRWPTVNGDNTTRHAVDVLCVTELPTDLQERGQFIRRVLGSLTNVPPAGPDGDAARITHSTLGPAAAFHGSDRAR